MRRIGLLGIILLTAVSCKPKPQPPAGDSTAVVLPDTMDSVGTDSMLLDPNGPVADVGDLELTADDTALTAEDSAYIAHRKSVRSATRFGLPTGASQYPPDSWCGQGINATTFNAAPSVVAAIIRKANDCGVSGVVVPPRRLFTSNGQSQGPFVQAKYEAMIRDYAAVLTPAFVAQYGPTGTKTLLAFQIFDDHKCPFCWGAPGVTIPSSTVAELARYTKQKLPSALPRGLRIEPSLLMDYRGWNEGDVDYTNDQWTMKKRPPRYTPVNGSVTQQKAWYRYQDSLGRVVLKTKWHMRQVSLGDIYPPDGPQITPTQLRDFYTTALTYEPSANCGNVSWMWENFFSQNTYKAVWFDLISMARTISFKPCKGGPIADVPPDSTLPNTTVVVIDSADTATPAAQVETASVKPHKPHRRP
jgi:hypothetical protein